jgi:cytidylate kinase
MKNDLIIAIDGPAASGKSTTAKLVAQKLGYLYIDTGAMYRALTLKALRENTDLEDEEALTQLAQNTHIELKKENERFLTFLDGEDVSDEIREPNVSRNVSIVCMPKGVRQRMVTLQRKMGKSGSVVLEGRDIGTVVFPHADLKIYMIASIETRAQRRIKDLEANGHAVDIEELKEEIRRRDEQDSQRTNSPLKKAVDAYLLDTTHLSIEQQVATIVEKAREIMA